MSIKMSIESIGLIKGIELYSTADFFSIHYPATVLDHHGAVADPSWCSS